MQPSTTTTIFLIIVVSVAISTCYSLEDEHYYTCLRNFSCGPNIQNVGFPFWGNDRPQYCGLPSFELKCQNDEYPTMEVNNWPLRVLEINQPIQTITMARSDLLGDDHCAPELRNFTLDNNLYFHYGPLNRNLFIFYNCTSEVTIVFPNNSFTCGGGVAERYGIYMEESLLYEHKNSQLPCGQSIKVPVWMTMGEIWERSLTLEKLLKRGFEVTYVTNVNSGRGWNVKLKLAIGFGSSGLTLLVMGVLIFLYQRRNKKRYGTWSWTSRNISSHPSSMMDLEQPGAFYGVHIFKYSELEKATANFDSSRELGDGGFGTVYQGE